MFPLLRFLISRERSSVSFAILDLEVHVRIQLEASSPKSHWPLIEGVDLGGEVDSGIEYRTGGCPYIWRRRKEEREKTSQDKRKRWARARLRKEEEEEEEREGDAEENQKKKA